MSIPDWVVDQRIEETIHNRFNGDRSALLEAMSREHLTYDEWRQQVANGVIVSAMRSENVDRHVQVSPLAVRRRYERDRDKYRRPATVNLRMISLRKGRSSEETALKREAAQDARRRLLAGEDFGVLARDLSEGLHAERGGDWGWTEPGDLRSELARAQASVETGEISEIIETEDEFYILKIEGRKEESITPFDEVQPQIEEELRRRRAEVLYKEWIERLKRDAYVKVFDMDPFPSGDASH
jgi:peptidyl-prolyl cis-trans isomerase SurA